jgi:hypothetical protein
MLIKHVTLNLEFPGQQKQETVTTFTSTEATQSINLTLFTQSLRFCRI